MTHSLLVPHVFIRRQLGCYLSDEDQAASLLASHNILPSALTSEGYVESTKLASLANTVWRQLDDESTGGAIKRLPFGFFKMLCRACGDCKNLQSLIYRSCEFFRIFSDEYKFALEIRGEEAIFVMKHQVAKGDMLPNNHDYYIMCLSIVLTRWFAWMIDEAIKLERIEFQFPAFATLDDFESIYHSSVIFGQESTRIVFPIHFLKKEVVASQEKLPAFLINAPHCFLSHYRKSNSTAEQVRKILSKSETFTFGKMTDIAAQLNCSIATLTRKLKNENTTFMELKDRNRKHRAMQLLHTTDISVSEISEILGFSEPSAFTRAFKKWTGDSPGEFRTSKKT